MRKIFGGFFLLWLVAAFSARAYVVNLNSRTNAEHWSFLAPSASVPTNVLNRTTHALRYYLAADGYSTTNKTAELNAVRAALGQWAASSNTVIKFEEAAVISPPVDVNTADGTNIFYWTKTSTIVNGGTSDISGALGVTFASFTSVSNEILQADIVFNGKEYQWFTDFFNTNSGTPIFVEGVALHEIGHLLGLDHSPLGSATMFFVGGTGINVQDGLSSDDIAAARCLYATNLSGFGALKGLVTVGGAPVIGAMVVASEAVSSNDVMATVTWTNGTYAMNGLPAGNYRLRVLPLDPSAPGNDSLCTGPDISATYNNAFTTFLPTTNQSVTLTANVTNTVNFTVVNSTPAFRITSIRAPSTTAGSFLFAPLPAAMTVGQSNYFIGVGSSNLPTSNATFTITGDGLALGTPTYNPNLGGLGLNFISLPISIASNATPGLRTFVVQQGTNSAYAVGYLKIRPAVLDYNFDGVDDRFQRKYFSVFTATNAGPAADPDGDGANNFSESIAGTIPTNAASLFKFYAVTNSSIAGTTVRWLSVSNKTYQVFSSTNLALGAWQSNSAAITASGTNTSYLDPKGTNGARFYRVQVFP